MSSSEPRPQPTSQSTSQPTTQPEAQPRPKGRKNGLYAGLSEELSALMRTGWADTEQRDLQPGEQAPHAAVPPSPRCSRASGW